MYSHKLLTRPYKRAATTLQHVRTDKNDRSYCSSNEVPQQSYKKKVGSSCMIYARYNLSYFVKCKIQEYPGEFLNSGEIAPNRKQVWMKHWRYHHN